MEGNIRKLARLVGLDPKKGGNKKQRHLKIQKEETFTTNFHPSIFTNHFDQHAFLYTLKQPLKITQFISPTYFHTPISTHLFLPFFFNPPLFTLSLVSPTSDFTYSQDHPILKILLTHRNYCTNAPKHPICKLDHHLKKQQEEEEAHERLERATRVPRPGVPNL